jgi:hypothetical protein
MKAMLWSALGVLCVIGGCKVTDGDDDDDGGEGGESGAEDGGSSGRGGSAGSTGASAGDGGTAGSYAGKGGAAAAGEGGEAGEGQAGNAGGEAGQGGQSGEGGEGGVASGNAGETGEGGAGGDGSQWVEEGPPGSVGNKCTEQGACNDDLECAQSLYCQPALSQLPAEIVQAVPPPDTANIPAWSPLMLFADGQYSGASFIVTAYTSAGADDITDEVTVTKLTSGANKDVWVITPKQGYPLGASVVVVMTGPWEGRIVFNVDHESPAYAEGSLAFDNDPNPEVECGGINGSSSLPIGWTGFGDFGVIPETGTVEPTSPDGALALTTGNFLCGAALEDTSTMVVSGPIRGYGSSPSFEFDYNFQSTEFDDFCNSSYDDTLLAVLSGPNGAVATMIDSVNVVCARADHEAATFPGMPDDGDSVYKQTGNRTFTLAGPVGSPAILSFVVTDVSDEIYSTLVSIDTIRAE